MLILIETEYQGLTYPETIEAIYSMENEMREVGVTVTSVADSLKEINDVLERNAIIEKMAEFANVDEIVFDRVAKEGIVDNDYSKTIIFVYFPVGIFRFQPTLR